MMTRVFWSRSIVQLQLQMIFTNGVILGEVINADDQAKEKGIRSRRITYPPLPINHFSLSHTHTTHICCHAILICFKLKVDIVMSSFFKRVRVSGSAYFVRMFSYTGVVVRSPWAHLVIFPPRDHVRHFYVIVARASTCQLYETKLLDYLAIHRKGWIQHLKNESSELLLATEQPVNTRRNRHPVSKFSHNTLSELITRL